MQQEPKFTEYLVKVLCKSFATWHGHEKWMAIATYLAVGFLLPIWFKDGPLILNDTIDWFIATAALIWLGVSIIFIGPFLLWRESAVENSILQNRIDVREKRLGALRQLGEIYAEGIRLTNNMARGNILVSVQEWRVE